MAQLRDEAKRLISKEGINYNGKDLNQSEFNLLPKDQQNEALNQKAYNMYEREFRGHYDLGGKKTKEKKIRNGNGEDTELNASLEKIIRRIQNNDKSAMDLLKGSNYLGSTISDIAPSDKGVFITLANGDTHDIDVSTKGGAYNEFLNALRSTDAKKRQDIIEVSKQDYEGNTDWNKLNTDVAVIQDAYNNPDNAKKMLTDLGFTKPKWEGNKLTAVDPKGVKRELVLGEKEYRDYMDNQDLTDEEIHKYMYEDVKKLLTETSRDNYIVNKDSDELPDLDLPDL